ncbi:SymE family type I addiction module toxin [Xanthomonas sp. NCPPB 3005]
MRAAVYLSGRWLEELGFAIGKKLRVRDGELVVSLATED